MVSCAANAGVAQVAILPHDGVRSADLMLLLTDEMRTSVQSPQCEPVAGIVPTSVSVEWSSTVVQHFPEMASSTAMCPSTPKQRTYS